MLVVRAMPLRDRWRNVQYARVWRKVVAQIDGWPHICGNGGDKPEAPLGRAGADYGKGSRTDVSHGGDKHNRLTGSESRQVTAVLIQGAKSPLAGRHAAVHEQYWCVCDQRRHI